jgi:hypothetical protein
MAWTSEGSAAGHGPSPHDRVGQTTCPGKAFEMTAVGQDQNGSERANIVRLTPDKLRTSPIGSSVPIPEAAGIRRF